MGGTFSSTGRGSITREQLLRSTTNSRDFTNKLFNVMLEKLTPADFLALGNPNKCSTFVFMMADSIHNLFRDLRIRPKRDRDSGIVMFQKVDTLKAQTAENRELCMTIAYFYIRIFQIFGALAMSILDDPGAGGVLGAVRYAPPQQPVGPFGFGQQKRIPGSYPTVLRGGAVPAEYFRTGYGRRIAPIKQILDESNPVDTGTEILPKFTFKGAPGISLVPGKRYNQQPENLTIQLSKKMIDDESDTFQIHCDLSINRIDDTHYNADIRNFRVSFGSETEEQITSRLKGFAKQFQITVNPETKRVTVRGLGISVPEQLLRIGKEIFSFYKELSKNPYASIEEIAVTERQRKIKQETERLGPGYKLIERDGKRVYLQQPGVQVGTVGISKELQNQYIIDILKSMSGQSAPGQKTVAFCIARALQLLDANTIYTPKPQQGLSGVCMAKFDSLPTSVPQFGQTIGTVPGIRAVDQLFYVNPAADHVRITDPAEYSQFLQQISGLFGRPTSAKLSKLDEILARDPNCGSSATKQYLQIQDPAAIKAVLGIIGQMFSRQLAHTQRVIQFFRQRLFTIVRGREGEIINIHPRLLLGGIGELAAVSKEARELLIQYYKDCETLYQRGAELILRAKRA
jgi:hypothetical protein